MRFTARTFRRAFVGAVAITVAVLGYGEVFMSHANAATSIKNVLLIHGGAWTVPGRAFTTFSRRAATASRSSRIRPLLWGMMSQRPSTCWPPRTVRQFSSATRTAVS